MRRALPISPSRERLRTIAHDGFTIRRSPFAPRAPAACPRLPDPGRRSPRGRTKSRIWSRPVDQWTASLRHCLKGSQGVGSSSKGKAEIKLWRLVDRYVSRCSGNDRLWPDALDRPKRAGLCARAPPISRRRVVVRLAPACGALYRPHATTYLWCCSVSSRSRRSRPRVSRPSQTIRIRAPAIGTPINAAATPNGGVRAATLSP